MKPHPPVENSILNLRGLKVILDVDLAAIYGVSTKHLNQQVKRNADRFPEDFGFLLSPKDLTDLRSQIATSNSEHADIQYDGSLKSQFVTSKRGCRRDEVGDRKTIVGGRAYRPTAESFAGYRAYLNAEGSNRLVLCH